ncbi:MAG: type II secretion system protein [Armatimonadota bacterium]
MKLFFNRKSRGFSLIEVVIAIVILFSVATVICMLYPVSFKGMAKAKDKTVSMALAQQKLEECLTNPRGNYTSGDFSPEYPDYRYDVVKAPVSWTKKLKELKVEVYKMVNGKKVVGAAMAQLVPSDGIRFYDLRNWNSSAIPRTSSWVPMGRGMSKTIDFPDDGVCMVNGTCTAYGPSIGPFSGILLYLAIACDGGLKGYTIQNAISAGNYHVGLATSAAFKVAKGSHTIALYYLASGGVNPMISTSHMTIQYIPASIVDLGLCEFIAY